MKTPMSPAIFDFAPFLLWHLLDCPKKRKGDEAFSRSARRETGVPVSLSRMKS